MEGYVVYVIPKDVGIKICFAYIVLLVSDSKEIDLLQKEEWVRVPSVIWISAIEARCQIRKSQSETMQYWASKWYLHIKHCLFKQALTTGK